MGGGRFDAAGVVELAVTDVAHATSPGNEASVAVLEVPSSGERKPTVLELNAELDVSTAAESFAR